MSERLNQYHRFLMSLADGFQSEVDLEVKLGFVDAADPTAPISIEMDQRSWRQISINLTGVAEFISVLSDVDTILESQGDQAITNAPEQLAALTAN